MEKILKLPVLLSLEDMAICRLVVSFWSDSGVIDSVMEFHEKRRFIGDWQTIEDKIKDKILKLELPKSLTNHMNDVARSIGLELRRWMRLHEKTFHFSCSAIYEHNSPKLYFTSAGTIDDRRMAEELVLCERLNIVQRYQIACSYWLEDYIPLFWEKLTSEDKDHFSKKNSALQGLPFSWPRIVNGREPNLDCFLRQTDRNLTSFNQWAFEHSVKMLYKPTAEYFFQKLSHDQKEDSLMRCARTAFLNRIDAPDEKLYDVFCYLLALMSPKQQMEIVKACPLGVLSCFLDWPRKDFFLETADLIWPFLPPRVYGDLLQKVIFRYDKNDFPKFFPDFYRQSPLDFKNYFLFYGASSFLSKIFEFEDSDSIKVLFRIMDVADRVRFVFERDILRSFLLSTKNDKWHLVEVCLREAMLSGEDKKRLKETFLGNLEMGFLPPSSTATEISRHSSVLQMYARDPKMKIFYDFLDETDASAVEKR